MEVLKEFYQLADISDPPPVSLSLSLPEVFKEFYQLADISDPPPLSLSLSLPVSLRSAMNSSRARASSVLSTTTLSINEPGPVCRIEFPGTNPEDVDPAEVVDCVLNVAISEKDLVTGLVGDPKLNPDWNEGDPPEDQDF